MDCAPQGLSVANTTENSAGRVIWITGLSGAGKTTLAKALQKEMPGSILLDGDDLRWALDTAADGFDLASRKNLAGTYARIAFLLAKQGVTVIVATISLFHDIHAWNRANLPGYFEVFLDVPLEERQRRDPKGLYAAEKNLKKSQMSGCGVAAELPENPDVRFGPETPAIEAVEMVLAALKT